MKTKNGFYSVVQYATLPLSEHVDIIGVVLFCSEPHFIGALFTVEGMRMVESAIKRGRNISVQIGQSLANGRDAVAATAVFHDLAQLKEFLSTLGREVHLTAAARVEVANPLLAMDALLNQCAASNHGNFSPIS